MLVDLHTHILPAIDDGPDTIGESLAMLKQAKESGVNKIVLTPHYIKGDSDKSLLTADIIQKQIEKLKKTVNEEGINIELLPGCEVYFFSTLGGDLEDGLITPINNSSYFLVEFPTSHIPENYINVFYDVYHLGYKPILCHPERNKEIIKDPNILYDLLEADWIFAQVNSSSLLGTYGSRVKKTAEALVKNNLVQLIGSDCHSINKRYPSLVEGLNCIKKINGKQNIFIENNHRVIRDKDLRLLPARRVLPGIINIMRRGFEAISFM